MTLNIIGTNQTEIVLRDMNIFFSYQTPVVIINKELKEVYLTEYSFSRTTKKHIDKYFKERVDKFIYEYNYTLKTVKQNYIESLV